MPEAPAADEEHPPEVEDLQRRAPQVDTGWPRQASPSSPSSMPARGQPDSRRESNQKAQEPQQRQASWSSAVGTTERRAPSTSVQTKEEMPPPDIDEPLVLIGDVNDWDMDLALQQHRLERRIGRNPKPDIKESKIRIEVPAGGTSFVIASALNPRTWTIFPGRGDGVMREGDRGTPVNLVVGQRKVDATDGRFILPGMGQAFSADVRVALRRGLAPEVWFTEAA
mmetsp:Transcript_54463/g.170111  ORF Transcript_54463/g.170111 Transcript_54463/m.170111 type:complete len:225 (-) Transcript_54463:37-711(-)